MITVGIDQSLVHTGIVVVDPDPQRPVLLGKHKIEAQGLVDGTDNMLRRAAEMAAQEWPTLLASLLDTYGEIFIVHEMPTMSNRLQKPESSMLAALGLRIEADRRGVSYIPVSANVAKAHFTGSGNAKKAQMRERLWQQFPEFKQARLNEHQADAIALVIAHHYPENSVKNRR